jgi:SAM-dependent methyltransferase
VEVFTVSTYVFDPAWTLERDRLMAIESLFDEDSMRYLLQLGLFPGWHCLEVGCGAGGIAHALADLVGDHGRVVAIDLDTRFMDHERPQNLEVRRQDLMVDPFETGAFDLVHARAVIEHIPDHQGAFERLVAAARPGGWVVIEDVDFGGAMAAALARYFDPPGHARLAQRVMRAVEALFAAAGADACFGTRLIGGLKAAGLEDVAGALHTPLVPGGTEWLVRGTVRYMGPRLADTGLVSDEEVECFLDMADDSSSNYTPPLMVTGWGRRPVL